MISASHLPIAAGAMRYEGGWHISASGEHDGFLRTLLAADMDSYSTSLKATPYHGRCIDT